jgi:hypothetical protein
MVSSLAAGLQLPIAVGHRWIPVTTLTEQVSGMKQVCGQRRAKEDAAPPVYAAPLVSHSRVRCR